MKFDKFSWQIGVKDCISCLQQELDGWTKNGKYQVHELDDHDQPYASKIAANIKTLTELLYQQGEFTNIMRDHENV